MARRKKKIVPKVDPGLLEYEGWNLEDVVWFCTMTEATPREGVIVKFHPEDSIAPAVSLNDKTGGGYRVTLVEYIFNTKKEAKDARPAYLEFWENWRKEKKS